MAKYSFEELYVVVSTGSMIGIAAHGDVHTSREEAEEEMRSRIAALNSSGLPVSSLKFMVWTLEDYINERSRP